MSVVLLVGAGLLLDESLSAAAGRSRLSRRPRDRRPRRFRTSRSTAQAQTRRSASTRPRCAASRPSPGVVGGRRHQRRAAQRDHAGRESRPDQGRDRRRRGEASDGGPERRLARDTSRSSASRSTAATSSTVDKTDGAPVVIVNRTMTKYWKKGSPIGGAGVARQRRDVGDGGRRRGRRAAVRARSRDRAAGVRAADASRAASPAASWCAPRAIRSAVAQAIRDRHPRRRSGHADQERARRSPSCAASSWRRRS